MIRQWFRNFMIGRYGVDQLSIAMMVLALVIGMVSSLAHLEIVSLLSTVLMVLVIFRTYSRNTNARWKENAKFLPYWQKMKQWFRVRKQHFDDRHMYRYFSCPNCRQTLRVPKGKGKICITCPRCKTELIRKT